MIVRMSTTDSCATRGAESEKGNRRWEWEATIERQKGGDGNSAVAVAIGKDGWRCGIGNRHKQSQADMIPTIHTPTGCTCTNDKAAYARRYACARHNFLQDPNQHNRHSYRFCKKGCFQHEYNPYLFNV